MLSLVTYFTSPLVLTLWHNALLIFSSFSEAMKALLAECRAFRLSCKTSEDGFIDKASKLSDKVDGSLGFLPKMSWNGEKPAVF